MRSRLRFWFRYPTSVSTSRHLIDSVKNGVDFSTPSSLTHSAEFWQQADRPLLFSLKVLVIRVGSHGLTSDNYP